MNYEFNNEFLAKSLISLVRDEGNRIVKANLATYDNVKSLVQPALELTIDNINIYGSGVILNTLSVLHNELRAVKLPGDFHKVSGNIKEQFKIILGYEQELEDDIILDDIKIIEDTHDTSIIAQNNIKKEILRRLSNIVYELGLNGNHKVAYLIERKMHEIENIELK
jgi:hypothetical protein